MRGILYLALASSALVAAAPRYGCEDKSMWCDKGDADNRIFFYCVEGKVSESACVTGTICNQVSNTIECALAKQSEPARKSRKLGKRATVDDVKDSTLYKLIRSTVANVSIGSSSKVANNFSNLTQLVKNDPDQLVDYIQALTTVVEDASTSDLANNLASSIVPSSNNTAAITKKITTGLKGLKGNEKKASDLIVTLFSTMKNNDELKNEFVKYLFTISTLAQASEVSNSNTSSQQKRLLGIDTASLDRVIESIGRLINTFLPCKSKAESTISSTSGGSSLADLLKNFLDGDIGALGTIIDGVLSFVQNSPQTVSTVITGVLKLLTNPSLNAISTIVGFLFDTVMNATASVLDLVQAALDFLMTRTFILAPITAGVMLLNGLSGVCIGDILYVGVSIIGTVLSLALNIL
ncbi:hypothetical protein AX774_g5413 [Zancudomyces culisetae]|uniref:Uncharacterized protein n=1 Tax=Zancudomyces culisetae TaxID=1213189 RepID=A0A1R1PJK4_ZANCU|nr:hypothetical protein AX774_g5413 [Zancudomyces culisetae]|eukprot:OMH81136.1 hypothetical protein AX774_g5413 [Zancudomyces culisetae]